MQTEPVTNTGGDAADTSPQSSADANKPQQAEVEAARKSLNRLMDEIQKVFVGQAAVVKGVVLALLSQGNVLLEGAPGLGKTLLVRVLSECIELKFSRVQFTPDLMPADITGTQTLVRTPEGGTELVFKPGPIFANIVLADEINRATPKTQSALLEAMQEHAVTVAGDRMVLEEPFFVLATQNPLEMEGTYALPEAQLDRFLLKVDVGFPTFEVLREIGEITTGIETRTAEQVMTARELVDLQKLLRRIICAPHVVDYAARLTLATHPESDLAPEMIKRFVQNGASPRAVQALMLAGRVGAAMAAEIGTMKVTEQVDALRAMDVHPIDYLVTPRFLAMLVISLLRPHFKTILFISLIDSGASPFLKALLVAA